MASRRPVRDMAQHARQDHVAQRFPAGRGHALRQQQPARIQVMHAGGGVEHDGPDGGEGQQEVHRIIAHAEGHHGDRHPGQRRDHAQELHGGRQRLQPPEAADSQPQRHAHSQRQPQAHRDAAQADQDMGGQVRAGQQHGQRAQGRTGRETPRHRAFGRQHGGAQPPGQRHNRQPQHAQAGAARQSRRPSAGTGARQAPRHPTPRRPGPRPPPWTASRSRLHLLAADVALGKPKLPNPPAASMARLT